MFWILKSLQIILDLFGHVEYIITLLSQIFIVAVLNIDIGCIALSFSLITFIWRYDWGFSSKHQIFVIIFYSQNNLLAYLISIYLEISFSWMRFIIIERNFNAYRWTYYLSIHLILLLFLDFMIWQSVWILALVFGTRMLLFMPFLH